MKGDVIDDGFEELIRSFAKRASAWKTGRAGGLWAVRFKILVAICWGDMLGFGKKGSDSNQPVGSSVSSKLCTNEFNGKYPHVGLYDCRERRVWVAKPLNGQAIRTSHARLITGAENATSTVWKDRFLCFWFYTPNTGQGYILGYPIDWSEAHLLVRIDPHWDYDRQRLIMPDLTDQVDDNIERQIKHGLRIFDFFVQSKLPYAVCLHLVGQRASESQFYLKRIEGNK